MNGAGESEEELRRGAEIAYEVLAPGYDDLTWRNDYEQWVGLLLAQLGRHGLRQGRLLDVGCGTGRAFGPMLSRGWEVQGCDVSAAMLAQARDKFGDAVPLTVADARELPVFGEFELVWALNDVANYLVGDGELERMLAGMRTNLAPGGLLAFDTNTLALFRANFRRAAVEEEAAAEDAGNWRWEGLADELEPGGTFAMRLSGEGVEPHVHRERHHPLEHVAAAIAAAGLKPLATLGQHEEAREGGGLRILLDQSADDTRHEKIVHIARAAT